MVLLKATEFSEETGKKEIFNLADIAAEARAIIESARKERENILATARQEAEKIRQQAQRKGYDKGLEEGLVQGQEKGLEKAFQEAREDFKQKTELIINQLGGTLDQVDQIKQRLLWQAEQDTVALAVCIAEKVIKKASLLHHEIARENLKYALEMIAGNTNIVVRVNPQDEEYLLQIASERDKVLRKYSSIRFEADDTVAPGGCVVQTDSGLVDAQLDTQIGRITNELLMREIEA
jgi:flagellar assembly protein FliH